MPKPKPTMSTLAEELGISINAVSLALNNRKGVSDELRTKIVKLAEQYGYFQFKKKYLAPYSAHNICLIQQDRFLHDHDFYFNITKNIEYEARVRHLDTFFTFIDENNLCIPDCIVQHKVMGIIAVGPLQDATITALKNTGYPLVLVDTNSMHSPTDSITNNNRYGSYIATQFLYDQGLKTIGFFGDVDYSRSVEERYWGYHSAIRAQLKISDIALEEFIDRHSVKKNLELLIIKNELQEITKLVRGIAKMPEAFVCSNDRAASLLMKSLQDLKYKVPQDISIIGFDDSSLCEILTPKLTSLRIHKEVMAKKAIEKLLERQNNMDSPPENITIGVELVSRDSVKLKV